MVYILLWAVIFLDVMEVDCSAITKECYFKSHIFSSCYYYSNPFKEMQARNCLSAGMRKHSTHSLTLSLSHSLSLTHTYTQVLDARDASTPKEMFDAICHHIKYANNGGNLR